MVPVDTLRTVVVASSSLPEWLTFVVAVLSFCVAAIAVLAGLFAYTQWRFSEHELQKRLITAERKVMRRVEDRIRLLDARVYLDLARDFGVHRVLEGTGLMVPEQALAFFFKGLKKLCWSDEVAREYLKRAVKDFRFFLRNEGEHIADLPGTQKVFEETIRNLGVIGSDEVNGDIDKIRELFGVRIRERQQRARG